MQPQAFFSVQAPLEASPARGMMRAANLKGLGRFVRRREEDPYRIIRDFDVPNPMLLSADHHIHMKTYVDVFERCSDVLSDRLFGLKLGQTQAADVFGCVTTLCRSASDFRAALQNFIEFVPVVHSPDTRLELFEGKEVSEFRYGATPDYGLCDQSKFQAVMLNLKLLREICGDSFQPSYVSLAVDVSRKEIDEIENLIGCRFHVSRDNAIAFRSSYLTLPAVHANNVVFELLRGYLSRVKAAARTTVIEQVEDYIRSALPTGSCSISRCAKRLGISERTLQLHLNEHGKRFSTILEEQRTVLARFHLERDDLTLDDIAVMLGYSEQSSFGRAFKRWTNVTPQQFRENRRELSN